RIIPCTCIISTLLLAITLFGHGYFHQSEIEILPGIAILYVLEAATLVLSILGVYGARKEKKWAVVLVSLLSQSVSLIPDLLVLSWIIIIGVGYTAQTDLGSGYRRFLCCELFLSDRSGHEDGFQCVAPGNNTRFVIHYPNSDMSEDDDHKGLMDEHMLVYKEPCLPILISEVYNEPDIGVDLAITILCQMRRKVNVPPVIFTFQPPVTTSLCDTAESV
uniref:Uncharacterized protein n=1 Tax=Hucho hucho TaxID=62062 RepID=A0A4W5N2X5_9TELE